MFDMLSSSSATTLIVFSGDVVHDWLRRACKALSLSFSPTLAGSLALFLLIFQDPSIVWLLKARAAQFLPTREDGSFVHQL